MYVDSGNDVTSTIRTFDVEGVDGRRRATRIFSSGEVDRRYSHLGYTGIQWTCNARESFVFSQTVDMKLL